MISIDQNLFLLFSRLSWPSGMVRERTCAAIADLLNDSDWTDILQRSVLQWMKEQKLESMTVIGLLIFCKAKIENSSFRIPSTDIILSHISKPSILSCMLINELDSNNLISP